MCTENIMFKTRCGLVSEVDGMLTYWPFLLGLSELSRSLAMAEIASAASVVARI